MRISDWSSDVCSSDLILRRAYGVRSTRTFWHYRLTSIGLIIASVVLTLVAFGFQVVLVGIEQFLLRVLPLSSDAAKLISITRIAPAIALFAASSEERRVGTECVSQCSSRWSRYH